MEKNKKEELIYSQSKNTIYVSWFLSLFLLLLTVPIFMNGYDKADGMVEVLILSIFPFIHLLILLGALISTFERIKFGNTPLLLDPKEASLNGDIGGVISLGRIFKEGDVLKVILSNQRATTTYYYSVGDRKKNSRIQTDLIWEDEVLVKVEKIDGKPSIQFLFQMNKDKKKFATQSRGDIEYYWAILLSSNEINFNRTFIISVRK